MKCNNCGKVVDDDSNFCVYCGSEIKNIIEVKYLQDDVYVSSSQISIAEMQIIKHSFPQIRRIISKPTAVILALFKRYEYEIEKNVAIVTIDKKNVEVGVLSVGEGVFEELHKFGIEANDTYIQMLNEISRSIGRMDYLVIASDGKIEKKSISEIETVFGTSAEYYRNLDELLVSGASVYSGVFKGTVRDVLLLQQVTNSLYCETSDSKIVDLVESKSIIPTKQKSSEIITNASRLFIKEDGYNTPIAIIQLNDLSTKQSERRIVIESDIDSNFKIKIIVTDIDSNEKYETTI